MISLAQSATKEKLTVMDELVLIKQKYITCKAKLFSKEADFRSLQAELSH